MSHPLLLVGLTLIGLSAGGREASAAPHAFVVTYRNFGAVEASSVFKPAAGYEVRSEGCYAKHSEEAICGFTLRATRPLTVTNLENVAHASGADGSAIRSCCMFVQGDDRGYPITTATNAPAGAAILNHPLQPGQEVGLMFRVPNYRRAAVLSAITFSPGHGDQGIEFPEHVKELP